MQAVDQTFDKDDIPKTLWFASKALKFPCTTAATSLVYWHRFCEYMDNGSLQSNKGVSPSTESDHIILCSSILFLAGKATECIRRIREVVNVVRLLFGHKPEDFCISEVSYSRKLNCTSRPPPPHIDRKSVHYRVLTTCLQFFVLCHSSSSSSSSSSPSSFPNICSTNE
jgi:hypothetical protein